LSCRWLLLASLLPPALHAAADPPAGEWKYDVIYRKKGDPVRGLVLEQTPASVKIRSITRKPGAATLLFTHVVPRAEVARLSLLSAGEREQLKERIEALKRERDLLADHLRALGGRGKGAPPPADLLDLQPAAWPGDPKAEAYGYQSAHFKLVARTSPELARLAAIHLEQIYDAYARYLPPRAAEAAPTTILLTGSLAEYQALARSRGLNLFNLAFYDPSRNQVVCGSDLERLRDELEKGRAYHAGLLQKVEERKAELTKAYKGVAVPKELLAPLAEAKASIDAAEERNARAFARAREKLFRRLYHEAFHAYLGTFVYPSKDGSLPLWFNEGLAQIFETAVVEVGELRVGRADRERWEAMRQALGRDTFLPLADLLRSGPKQYQVAHASDRQVSDRHYLAAWALAFYLTFEARLLGTPALDDYVRAVDRGVDPLPPFQDLVGQPLARFEKDFLLYLRRLQEDGTVKK
jgi:hypothetical protein